MGHHPERTCIGCRGTFAKDKVVRLVAGDGVPVIDYREKLPGRAAYVCPRRDCIVKALVRDQLSRAFRRKVASPSPEALVQAVTAAVRERISSLISMAAKAGMIAVGASAVGDALTKGRVLLLIFAADLSDGTKDKVLGSATGLPQQQTTPFTTEELGRMTGRDLVGIAGIIDKGFAGALGSELERLKGLIIQHV
jgi:predicted RNA-binding protein YlxR (DUF448 family)